MNVPVLCFRGTALSIIAKNAILPSKLFVHRSCNAVIRCRKYSSSSGSNSSSSTSANNAENSNRIANLGDTTKYLLEEGVPNLLQQNLKDSVLNEDLRLRILPLSFPYIPEISGRAKVQSSLSALRLVLHTFVVDKNSHLHVVSAKNITEDAEKNYSQLGYTLTTTKGNGKLLVKWQSCSDITDWKALSKDSNDSHEKNNVTRSERINLFDGKRAAASSVIDYILTPSNGRWKTVTLLGEQLRESRQGDHTNSKRVLSGIFVFELNADNTNVVAFTIEDVELTRFESAVKDAGNLFVCE